MPVRLLTSSDDFTAYDEWVKNHEHGSLWQSLEWKRYQESLGREVRVYSYEDAGFELRETAMIIIDRTNFGLSTWDCPRGPLVAASSNELRATSNETEDGFLIQRIIDDAKKDQCISLYLSPLIPLAARSSLRQSSGQAPLAASLRHEQPEATRILDLTLSDEQLLAQMHQKGRYNINVARKNNVIVERSADIDAYYALAKKTGKRDAFGIPSKRQLTMFLEKLEGSFLLLAYEAARTDSSELREKNVDSRSSELVARSRPAIAGLIGTTWNNQGIYYYGASDYEHRALMAPYLLQWESMKLCKKAGCTSYDLLGIAPLASSYENEKLRATSNDDSRSSKLEARSSSHPWAGISSFKEKFGGTVVSYPPEQKITLMPMVKRLLEVKRKWIG